MSNQPDNAKELIQQAAEKYSDITALRAAVQLIPYIGGTLDTLIGGEGQKIQQRRIAHLIDELDKRLINIEAPQHAIANEDLYDLMVSTFERVVKTRSETKRARFAQVVSNEIAHARNIDEAETAVRLVSELDDLHVCVLNTAIHAPFGAGSFGNVRVITITPHNKVPATTATSSTALTKIFPNIPEHMLRLICSELASKGLLKDEGIGRFDTQGMEYFVATDLAAWLFTWIESD